MDNDRPRKSFQGNKLNRKVQEKLNEYRRKYLNAENNELKVPAVCKETPRRKKKHNFNSTFSQESPKHAPQESCGDLQINELSKRIETVIFPVKEIDAINDSVEVLSPNISTGTPMEPNSYSSSRLSNLSKKSKNS